MGPKYPDIEVHLRFFDYGRKLLARAGVPV